MWKRIKYQKTSTQRGPLRTIYETVNAVGYTVVYLMTKDGGLG